MSPRLNAQSNTTATNPFTGPTSDRNKALLGVKSNIGVAVVGHMGPMQAGQAGSTLNRRRSKMKLDYPLGFKSFGHTAAIPTKSTFEEIARAEVEKCRTAQLVKEPDGSASILIGDEIVKIISANSLIHAVAIVHILTGEKADG